MNAVGRDAGMVREGFVGAFGLLERAAAEGVREFEAGRSSAKKRTRAQVERINREVVSANRATPRHLLREELILARSEIARR